jgi:hypothetical protein
VLYNHYGANLDFYIKYCKIKEYMFHGKTSATFPREIPYSFVGILKILSARWICIDTIEITDHIIKYRIIGMKNKEKITPR